MTVPQSQVQVDSIEAYDPVGPVVVSYGATVPSGATFTINGNANVTGIITAGTHSGIEPHYTVSWTLIYRHSVVYQFLGL